MPLNPLIDHKPDNEMLDTPMHTKGRGKFYCMHKVYGYGN